mmetsp:Transcript_16728/g.49940  ORF Transcript_16728/g.49940 Transcript_16728/m.49940 type:complete len:240 (+) Transcript_16728:125-844(+)
MPSVGFTSVGLCCVCPLSEQASPGQRKSQPTKSPGVCMPMVTLKHPVQELTALYGWNATAAWLTQGFTSNKFHPPFSFVYLSISRDVSVMWPTPILSKHCSVKKSSPPLRPRWSAHSYADATKTSTAFVERTSKAPWKLNLKSMLWMYTAVSLGARKLVKCAASLSGKNTASASTLTVQSFSLYMPSLWTCFHTAMKMSVFTTDCHEPFWTGAPLYTLEASHAKMPHAFAFIICNNSCS